MLALPNNAWDAYYLALTWRVRGKVPATIIDILEQLNIDMTDARAINKTPEEREALMELQAPR